MTDLDSARGHLKNARNQARQIQHRATHHAGPIGDAYRDDADLILDEVAAALDALAEAESDDEPPGDYYVLTPEHATLGDAHGPVTEVKARGMASTLRNADNATRAKVVHRPLTDEVQDLFAKVRRGTQ